MVAAADQSLETTYPLSDDEIRKTHAYWRACNYLCVGMIYLRDNPLLKEPLKPEHIKYRLLGHWGSSPGLSFIYIHLNRLIKKYDLNMIYIAGPGHGAPGVLGPVYLEGTYSEVYPDKSQDAEGMRKFFKQFSFPGGIGSHCTPETPGSIHEGGELGYSLSHAYGTVFDHPELITAAVVGDGEAETGPLATAWHSNKFINPIRDGAVLPILHLNGYKIANPTILSRIPNEELKNLFRGYGYTPYLVECSQLEDYASAHQKMATTLEHCINEIRDIQQQARSSGNATRPQWPMIILRSPKGWTGPKEVDGRKVEGFWRAHQVPMSNVIGNPHQMKILEDWMRSYQPEELFDENGTLIPELQELAPTGIRRMSANPFANGGILRRDLNMPDFRHYAVEVPKPGQSEAENTRPLGNFLRDVMAKNMTNFRMFGPDETASNRLNAVYEVSKKTWMGEFLEEDLDGSELATDGRVMEMLSEHTLQGWLEGYLLTGCHGFFHTYEAFAHVVDSMFNQHAKWLEVCKKEVPWRSPIASLNILLSSTVWRQDHNGFSHQDPGYVDLVTNKSPDVVRVYFPPDANCLLSCANHCLQSKDYVNVIVADKQKHLQFLNMDDAIKHCTKGIGIWEWASNDDCGKDPDIPDVVMASCGDVATRESLAATAILRSEFPELKIRFINVVDLFKLQPNTEHPHGLSDWDFDSLFTTDKPIIFNFHGYPWLIHKLAYRRTNHPNLHVRGYKEKGNINTPLELAIENQVDRFNLVIDVIDRVPQLRSAAAYVRERMRNAIIENVAYAYEHGQDQEEISNWKWPF
ncbi:phosphoketolase family protein [Arthrospira platensis]|jgi:xylulose-5-phosphate/fructose-6-phosphate phosphoketolase|uniref:Probable phosphoketolase n=1 Tax=Limnospira platensis NIES-46 TaxID=1236695 RepID=A0A5M3T2M5_LIMPL|nr:phosphoketolase family protein [Arthrospira platensis]AMW29936.1 phosphoketolase [Arthrospira platensis YZ]KDR54330.1 phosphoketolase [Arthrospira platensis str. Paraca]MBD2671008.1 phosphoketolase family protein [Arthrospira platensis FACHB-439]MBD2711766.1 phosphoketolase family protein [Arthrospira platensis FACHB-835]MDF2212023.1 phosphoketolase family protein [Arthrospira platensis NCB002]MDT9184328.1 phosphoketolase family protein [Limnospira sp. PMC 289.06]MDT9312174.1 phosphoketol